MSRRLLLAVAVATSLATLGPAAAHAEPPPPPASPAPPASPVVPAPRSWGWTLVAASVSIGAAVSLGSLVVNCPRDDLDCARWTSLGIWGGIGIASVGVLAGVLVVRASSRPSSRVQVSFTLDRAQAGASMPRATFAYSF